ncbi:AlbA family DNA-binding domain-containing protein [Methylobacterium indicum]|uniref:Schlafen AlbA-2 domain-containing protein n=1 Tax=Methylobacterium indicum TaxID=1775910 RepID=A0A8H8WY17_9HYPH|nr:ATP-binding protein [Methylobacterium indicum]BCM86490.1 hypothetical protein mvi_49510 [Methylobacterium indicum]
MTDEEVALVKAMLARGFRNDQAHFYFNRADRLLSSGRITQIKQGKYGSKIPAATPADLDAYLDRFNRQSRTEIHQELAPDHSLIVLTLFEEITGSWTLKAGETHRAECKLNFRLRPDYRFGDCIRTIAGFANNEGGYLLFGVEDGTKRAEGMNGEYFEDADPAEFNRILASALDPIPTVNKSAAIISGQKIGVLYVHPIQEGPVIALKNIGSDVKEGAVYYRYVGETRTIKPAELRQIIARRERRAVADFVRRMNMVQAGAAATLDLKTGEVVGTGGGFLIDRDLLPNIQFIKEGEFSEIRGAPALRLVGEVKPIDSKEEERVRTIRDAVTPDAIIRNFLLNEKVADPIQYIHAQAHYQQRWMPVWFYVNQSGLTIEDVIADIHSRVSTRPASRTALVSRLKREEEAFKVYPGRPVTVLCDELQNGGFFEVATPQDIYRFASAVSGLKDGVGSLDAIRSALLTCLDKSLGETAADGARRSLIFRASCRIDELMHRETCCTRTS